MCIHDSLDEMSSFAPVGLQYNVDLHMAITDRLEYAIRCICGEDGIVTTENQELVEALVEITNALDDDGIPELESNGITQREQPVLKVGDSVRDWMRTKCGIRYDAKKGPLALAIGRVAWVNVKTGDIVPAQPGAQD
jgi:hypothetical protein